MRVSSIFIYFFFVVGISWLMIFQTSGTLICKDSCCARGLPEGGLVVGATRKRQQYMFKDNLMIIFTV